MLHMEVYPALPTRGRIDPEGSIYGGAGVCGGV